MIVKIVDVIKTTCVGFLFFSLVPTLILGIALVDINNVLAVICFIYLTLLASFGIGWLFRYG